MVVLFFTVFILACALAPLLPDRRDLDDRDRRGWW